MQQNRPSRRNSVLFSKRFSRMTRRSRKTRCGYTRSDASLRRGPVLAMVCPRTVEQVRELMRWAEVERIPIHPRGRGTSLSGGCVPTRAGVVVSMLGMDRIFDISSEDFVAVIEPGVNTLAFQQACEQKGLFYPPDFPPVVRPRPWVVT